MPDTWDYSNARPPRRLSDAQTPLITWLLCGMCVLVTLAFHTSKGMEGSFWHKLGNLGISSPADIWTGKIFYLFTAFFNHGDAIHLLFNMMWMVRLGGILEATLRPWQYAAFLLCAAFVSSCAQLAFSGSTGIGASGVVYALFGLLWAGRDYHPAWQRIATRDNFNYMLGWGVLCIFLTYANILPVANFAHGGGFLFGLAIGGLFFAPRRQPAWSGALIGLAVLCVLSLTWLPWQWRWDFWKGNTAFERKDYGQAITWYQRSLRVFGDKEANWYNISAAYHNMAIAEDAQNHGEAAKEFWRLAEQATQKSGEYKEVTSVDTPAAGGSGDGEFHPLNRNRKTGDTSSTTK